MKKCGTKRTKNQIQKEQNLSCKKAYTAIINREKENGILAQPDQIRPQGEYEEKNEEEISKIPSVNDLLDQPLHNETSEDEIMHDQVSQSDFENSDE